MSTIVLQSERLICRHWIPEDFPSLLSVYSDAEAMRWVGNGRPITCDECHEWLKVTEGNYQKYGCGMFTLLERRSGLVVGFAGLVHPGSQSGVEIKYALDRAHWGRGLATEAVSHLLAYGASAHSMDVIIATVAEENLASRRVLAKAGMSLRGQKIDDDGSVTLVLQWSQANQARTPEAKSER